MQIDGATSLAGRPLGPPRPLRAAEPKQGFPVGFENKGDKIDGGKTGQV